MNHTPSPAPPPQNQDINNDTHDLNYGVNGLQLNHGIMQQSQHNEVKQDNDWIPYGIHDNDGLSLNEDSDSSSEEDIDSSSVEETDSSSESEESSEDHCKDVKFYGRIQRDVVTNYYQDLAKERKLFRLKMCHELRPVLGPQWLQNGMWRKRLDVVEKFQENALIAIHYHWRFETRSKQVVAILSNYFAYKKEKEAMFDDIKQWIQMTINLDSSIDE